MIQEAAVVYNEAVRRSAIGNMGASLSNGSALVSLEIMPSLTKQAEERDRKMIDAIPRIAWSSRPDGFVEFLNHPWLDYTGLSVDEAVGWGWNAAVHPDDRGPLTDRWRALLASGQGGEIEARLRRDDGEYRWFLIRAVPCRDEKGKIVKWYGTSTDIEDRKRTESLHAAEKRALEMIVDGASLKDVLNHLCSCIDVQVSPSVTTVLLMDPDGKRLWQSAGPLMSGRCVRWCCFVCRRGLSHKSCKLSMRI